MENLRGLSIELARVVALPHGVGQAAAQMWHYLTVDEIIERDRLLALCNLNGIELHGKIFANTIVKWDANAFYDNIQVSIFAVLNGLCRAAVVNDGRIIPSQPDLGFAPSVYDDGISNYLIKNSRQLAEVAGFPDSGTSVVGGHSRHDDSRNEAKGTY
jgi:hypothetical protein